MNGCVCVYKKKMVLEVDRLASIFGNTAKESTSNPIAHKQGPGLEKAVIIHQHQHEANCSGEISHGGAVQPQLVGKIVELGAHRHLRGDGIRECEYKHCCKKIKRAHLK